MGWQDQLAKADRACQAVFGTPVLYAPEEGGAVTVSGIFDSAYVRVNAGEAGVSSCGPAVFLRLEDLPTDPREDDADYTIEGATYRSIEAQPDGQGGVLVQLQKVTA